MTRFDHRGEALSGATPAAQRAYERALGAFLVWRSGAAEHLDQALREAPAFTTAHVLQAWSLLCSRDLRRLQAARPVVERLARLPANARERGHLAAIQAILADDYERAKALLGDLLHAHPCDALALHVSHSLDYVTGDVGCMNARVAAVLPAWSGDMPGYSAVLAMRAFALEEAGAYQRAEQAAREALALDPRNARAHHVMAHVFEMTDRAGDGVQWMNRHLAGWGEGTVVAMHCRWHLALFHLARREIDRALALYDQHMRCDRSSATSDLIDASALLWRLRLHGVDTGERCAQLAAAWEPYIEDAFCSFNDVHAMLAFVGAGDWDRAHRLERTLVKSQARPTRHGTTTRQLGLPAGRALMAHGRGDHARAISLFSRLPGLAHRLGGSHAQRDVLHMTLAHAIERIRRPARALRA